MSSQDGQASAETCGAKLPDGNACRREPIPGKARCRIHGGASTGAKTAEGRQRIALAQTIRWREISKALTMLRAIEQQKGAS